MLNLYPTHIVNGMPRYDKARALHLRNPLICFDWTVPGLQMIDGGIREEKILLGGIL